MYSCKIATNKTAKMYMYSRVPGYLSNFYLPVYYPPSKPTIYYYPYGNTSSGQNFCSEKDTFQGRRMGGISSEGVAIPPDKAVEGALSLRSRSLSYIRSFATGPWYSRLLNPPITAQFLKDVNFELHGAEIMAVVGSAGCGKTTLLNVLARRVQGSVGGSVELNGRHLTESLFQNNCAYVSFKQTLNRELTVEETLRFHARLALSPANISNSDKRNRVNELMRDFELISHADRTVEQLTESARRRLHLAYHLVRDPGGKQLLDTVLLVVDEPTRDLDALSAYQLMYDLYQYVKENKRMAVVTMSMPRSDIYQLFDRLTILFFGEVLYSGYTKQMPQYFRQIGYPCPAGENPAVYYLSLATVDRETSERYVVTQEQAVRLIEIFKGQGEAFSHYFGPSVDTGARLPLCHLGRPGVLSKICTLTRRSYSSLLSRKILFACRILVLPLTALIFLLFYFKLPTESRTAPQTRAGLIFNWMACVSILAPALASATEHGNGNRKENCWKHFDCSNLYHKKFSVDIHRIRYYQESWDNLYGGVTFLISQLLSVIVVDLITVFAAAAIIYWCCPMGRELVDYGIFAGACWCCFQFSQFLTIALMVFVESSYKAACSAATIVTLLLTFSAGFLKAYKTYAGSMEWLQYLTYLSLYRYVFSTVQYNQLKSMNTSCSKPEPEDATAVSPKDYCRWSSGMEYLQEIYPKDIFDHFWPYYGACFAYIALCLILLLIVYSLPMPHFVKRKFRFK